MISCSPGNNNTEQFADLKDREIVFIYLRKYNLDSIPKEIGTLTKAKRLYVSIDSAYGWTVYPPLSALVERTAYPPFKTLPNELTELTNLESLSLMDLNIHQLPDNFGNLENLDTLNLFLNKLTIAHELDKLTKLKNLKYLGIFGNKVDSADVQALMTALPGLKIQSGLEQLAIENNLKH